MAMNIGFDKITWVLEDKNRRLVDWQNTQFFEKVNFRYNHLHYQEKVGLVSGPEVIKLFSCSSQLRLKFILLINSCWHFNIY